MMKIDCCNLACPQPVLMTKKALEELANDDFLVVHVNSLASKENVYRFAKNQGHEVEVEELKDGKFAISIFKGFSCDVAKEEKNGSKNFFIKSHSIGDGELGDMLMMGFIKNILEQSQLPKNMIFVNSGVFITCQKQGKDVVDALKELEKRGVNIYSCGACLEYFGLVDGLKVGKVGNAYDVVRMLLESDGTITL